MDLPDEIINHIIMFSRPTYPFHDELKHAFKWHDYECSAASVLDSIRLLSPHEREYLSLRYSFWASLVDIL